MTKTFAERCKMFEQCLPDASYRDLLKELHEEMLAKLAEQPAPVQGWKLVPVKPTKEMVDALADTDPEHDSVWDAVLSAAPQAPAAQQEPVAWANPNDLQNFDMKVRTNGGPLHTVPLYTTPQAQPRGEATLAREPLTPEWYARWLRNNYQDYGNIATLCDEMTKAAHGITKGNT